MATRKEVKLSIGTKPLSAAAQKRVNAALRKTLEAELKREGATLGGIGARALDISGHGKGAVAKDLGAGRIKTR